MLDKNKQFLAALLLFPPFTGRRLRQLQAFFPNWETTFLASANDLAEAGLDKSIVDAFVLARTKLDVDNIAARLDKENIHLICQDEVAYPPQLAAISSPPVALFVRGDINQTLPRLVAIVGTRQMTDYGERAAAELSADLSRAGLGIVSGLALGIDTVAHRCAVDQGGMTVAVLGSGLDKQSIYPAVNRQLAEKIIDSGGLVISEFPCGTEPLRQNFPQRNRIIAGLSEAVVVVEAGIPSGALTTAEFASKYGRLVYAVPGSIFSPVSAGPNRLITQGGLAASDAKTILHGLGCQGQAVQKTELDGSSLSPEELAIIRALAQNELDTDEIIRLTGLDTSVINSTLSIMEIKGLATRLGSRRYASTAILKTPTA
jgi:DNA processing protein